MPTRDRGQPPPHVLLLVDDVAGACDLQLPSAHMIARSDDQRCLRGEGSAGVDDRPRRRRVGHRDHDDLRRGHAGMLQDVGVPRIAQLDAEDRFFLSGTKVRDMLRKGERPPKEFTRPEVADVLIKSLVSA